MKVCGRDGLARQPRAQRVAGAGLALMALLLAGCALSLPISLPSLPVALSANCATTPGPAAAAAASADVVIAASAYEPYASGGTNVTLSEPVVG